MKQLPPNALMLKGYERVGIQCTETNCEGDPRKPDAVCAIGAIQLVENGDATWFSGLAWDVNDAMKKATGYSITQINDGGMSIPDIAGILRAEGY